MKPLDPRLVRYVRATQAYLVVAVLLGLALAVLIVAQASLLSRIVVAAFLEGATLATVQSAMLLLLGVVVLRAALAWASELAAHLSAARAKSELRGRLLERALALGPLYLSGERSGELATTAARGIDALDAYFSRYLPQLVLAALVPLIVLAWMLPLDPASAVIVVVTLPLIPIFMVLIGLDARRRAARQWRVLSLLSAHFLDVLQGLPTLRVFGRGRAQQGIIRRVAEQYRQATMGTLRVAFLSALVLEMLATLSTALVAVGIGLRLVEGGIGLEEGLAILILTPEVYLPLRQVGVQFHASQEGMAAAERIFAVLDAPPPATLAGHEPAPDLTHARIVFERVGFVYPERSEPALDGVSFTLRPGERVALVGPSGSGKSTLLALLLRFAAPTSGRILVDGRDLAAVDPGGWRAQLAWLPQRPFLFNGTIADNIRLGRPAADLAAVRAAARHANALEFIEALPDGFDTLVGERGMRLSAGQRQRIALARAFLRDAPLLLLDEPTASLDVENEAAVGEALARLMAGRTVLLVLHRLALARGVDRVLVLESGRLRQSGAPADLGRRDGAYRQLLAAAGEVAG